MPFRFYIHAWRNTGDVILGNLDGQAALGDMKAPMSSAQWKRLRKSFPSRDQKYPRVKFWTLEREDGFVIDEIQNPHWSKSSSPFSKLEELRK